MLPKKCLGLKKPPGGYFSQSKGKKGKGGIDSLEYFFCLSKPFMHRLSPLLAACFLLYLPS